MKAACAALMPSPGGLMNSWVIGDLHGYYDHYVQLLKGRGLISDDLNWTGGDDRLYLIGDLFDRGPNGIGCIDLTMKLQPQAEEAGGQVNCLLGNHELMILCAYRFRDAVSRSGVSIEEQWRYWGGCPSDLDQFSHEHAAWICDLPAMMIVGNALLVHADAMLYVEHGLSVNDVNASFQTLMLSDDLNRWESTLSAFSEHEAFSALSQTGAGRAEQLLNLYGAQFMVHGHTPIPYAQRVPPGTVNDAWDYAGGRCVNVDGGIYMGGPGFVYELES